MVRALEAQVGGHGVPAEGQVYKAAEEVVEGEHRKAALPEPRKASCRALPCDASRGHSVDKGDAHEDDGHLGGAPEQARVRGGAHERVRGGLRRVHALLLDHLAQLIGPSQPNRERERAAEPADDVKRAIRSVLVQMHSDSRTGE